MSNPQGSGSYNAQWFVNLTNRANAVSTCADIQNINTQVNASVNGTMSAISSMLSEVNSQLSDLSDDITKITSQYGTLAASETSMTAVGTVGATAAAVHDLGTVIAYCKAQGLSLVSLGSTNTASFVAQALALTSSIVKFDNDLSRLNQKLTTLEAQLTEIPSALSTLQTTMNSVAASFPGCSL